MQEAWWLHIPQSFTSSSRRSGSSAPSLNVTLHLVPTAGVWHRTRSSATCAGCQLAVHADICCRGAGGARSVSTTTHRRTNNVPNVLLPSGWSASPAESRRLLTYELAPCLAESCRSQRRQTRAKRAEVRSLELRRIKQDV